MTPLLQWLMDISLAVLLAVTIGYCWMLNHRIRALQDARGELSKLLAHFDESTRRASDSISVLQATGKKAAEAIQARIERATLAADDLNYLIERAEKLAERMEAGISVGRTARKVQTEMAATVPPSPSASSASAPDKPAHPTALQAMLEKLAVRTAAPDVPPPSSKKQAESKARSRVEQELLEIIRAGRE